MQSTFSHVMIPHQAVKSSGAPRRKLPILGIGRFESRIANNLANLILSLERPLSLVGIRECFV